MIEINLRKNGTFLLIKKQPSKHHVFALNTTTPPSKNHRYAPRFCKTPLKKASKARFPPGVSMPENFYHNRIFF
jgi:hypothetical protein